MAMRGTEILKWRLDTISKKWIFYIKKARLDSFTNFKFHIFTDASCCVDDTLNLRNAKWNCIPFWIHLLMAMSRKLNQIKWKWLPSKHRLYYDVEDNTVIFDIVKNLWLVKLLTVWCAFMWKISFAEAFEKFFIPPTMRFSLSGTVPSILNEKQVYYF